MALCQSHNSPSHDCELCTAHPMVFLKSLLIYFWLCWVFIAVPRPSLFAVSGGYSLVAVHGLLTAVASLVAEHRL